MHSLYENYFLFLEVFRVRFLASGFGAAGFDSSFGAADFRTLADPFCRNHGSPSEAKQEIHVRVGLYPPGFPLAGSLLAGDAPVPGGSDRSFDGDFQWGSR